MDHETTYKLATDLDNDEPQFAALELLVWLASGGYVPKVGRSPAALAHEMELIIIDALEEGS